MRLVHKDRSEYKAVHVRIRVLRAWLLDVTHAVYQTVGGGLRRHAGQDHEEQECPKAQTSRARHITRV